MLGLEGRLVNVSPPVAIISTSAVSTEGGTDNRRQAFSFCMILADTCPAIWNNVFHSGQRFSVPSCAFGCGTWISKSNPAILGTSLQLVQFCPFAAKQMK